MRTKSKFCQTCPRRLNQPPTTPCPLAMEYLAAKQVTPGKEPEHGCPWAISSATHGHCFWSYADQIDGERIPDAEICALLGINQSTLEKTLASALDKLKAAKDEPEMQEWREAVLEAISRRSQDNTVYMPSSFKIESGLDEDPAQEELPLDLLPKAPPRRSRAQPIHRDGKKTDLFGLYSRRTKVDKQ